MCVEKGVLVFERLLCFSEGGGGMLCFSSFVVILAFFFLVFEKTASLIS